MKTAFRHAKAMVLIIAVLSQEDSSQVFTIINQHALTFIDNQIFSIVVMLLLK